jgi:hypothetical protein
MNSAARSILVLSLVAVVGCQPQARSSTVIQLATLNASGVTGAVTLVDLGDGRTQVGIEVEPAGNLDMPAHIHPGSCDNLTPQPRHPLQNVVNGTSTTIVRAPLEELLGGDLAVNIHRSNDDLRTYTACADL